MIDSVEDLFSYESPFYRVFAIDQDKQDTAVCSLSASDVDISSHNCDTDSYSKRKIVFFLFPRKTDKWSASCFKSSRTDSDGYLQEGNETVLGTISRLVASLLPVFALAYPSTPPFASS